MAGLGAMTEPSATSDEGVSPGSDNRSPQAARWGFWATVAWALLVAAIFIVVQTGTILAAAEWFPANPADRNLAQSMISGATKAYSFPLANVLTTIVCCGSIIAIVRLKKDAIVREYLCLKPVALVTMLKWTGLFVVATVATESILIWLDLPSDNDFTSTVYANAQPNWMLWLALVVAVPLFEEMFFRGFLLTGFASSFLGPIGAVLVTTGLWAALHTQYGVTGIAVMFCFGLLLGAARMRTGSLMVPLGLHALENLLATAAVAFFS